MKICDCLAGSAIGRPRQSLAIGQEDRQAVEAIGVGHPHRLTFAIGSDQVEFKFRKAMFVGREDQVVAAGMEVRRPAHRPDVGQSLHIGAIGLHRENLGGRAVLGESSPTNPRVRRAEKNGPPSYPGTSVS